MSKIYAYIGNWAVKRYTKTVLKDKTQLGTVIVLLSFLRKQYGKDIFDWALEKSWEL